MLLVQTARWGTLSSKKPSLRVTKWWVQLKLQISSVGKTLKQLGIADSDTVVFGPDRICDAVSDAEVYITFTAPAAEVLNVPAVAKLARKLCLELRITSEQDRIILRQLPTRFLQCSRQLQRRCKHPLQAG